MHYYYIFNSSSHFISSYCCLKIKFTKIHCRYLSFLNQYFFSSGGFSLPLDLPMNTSLYICIYILNILEWVGCNLHVSESHVKNVDTRVDDISEVKKKNEFHVSDIGVRAKNMVCHRPLIYMPASHSSSTPLPPPLYWCLEHHRCACT